MANIKSEHESGTISVTLSNSILGSQSIGDELHLSMNSYTHKRVANGGFWDANITLSGSLSTILPVIDTLIGLDMRTVSVGGDTIWNGFVNKVTLETGIGSFAIGPLMNVRNNLSVVYQTTRYNTIPPIGGQRRRLSPLGDSSSQELYGIFGYELSGGTGTSEGAANLQETHLNENKRPRVQQSLRVGASSSSNVSVSIQAIGYIQMLDKFIYAANVAGTTTPAAKILTIMQAESNGLFSELYAPDTNTLSVPNYEEGSTGWSIIKSIVAQGDTNFDRFIFQIGVDRIGTYRKIDSTYRYFLQPSGSVTKLSGHVNPWDIEPGYWMSASNLITGEQKSGDIGTHISDVFIESVTYNAPNTANIEGGNVDRSIQQLAQRGVGGSF